MKDPKRFYTYAYLREDGTPYYIGKGKGDRLYTKDKREFKPPKDKSRIIFLKQNLTEEEAFKHEIYMIAVLGRKDLGTGILRNKTDGGEGSSGAIVSEETRRKQSEARKGENNPNYGKKMSEEQKKKISEKAKGKKQSEETKRKNSESKKGKYAGKNHPMYGKSPSEETRKKQSEAMKGENNPNYGKSPSEETRKKRSEAMKGKKWWNDGKGNIKFSVECPGSNWVFGYGKKGKKWWNDGKGNSKMSIESPGPNWVLGRGTNNI